jgi:hypothetical protein
MASAVTLHGQTQPVFEQPFGCRKQAATCGKRQAPARSSMRCRPMRCRPMRCRRIDRTVRGLPFPWIAGSGVQPGNDDLFLGLRSVRVATSSSLHSSV